MKNKGIKTLALIFLLVGLASIITGSYALWAYNFTGSANVIDTIGFQLEFLESTSEVISVDNALPMSDEEGVLQAETFNFMVRSKSANDITIGYNLSVEKLTLDTGYTALDDSDIKIYLEDYDGNVLLAPTLISDLANYKFYIGSHVHSASNVEIKDMFKLRVWIDESREDDAQSWDMDTKLQYKFKIGLASDERAKRTVNVVVNNGSLSGSSTGYVANGANINFNLVPNNADDFGMVSCTNSQTGAVNNSMLTVSNVTSNTTCTVTFTSNYYTITYKAGNASSVRNLPSSQIKFEESPVTLSSKVPVSSNKIFLGWSTSSNATSSSTWYDPSISYSTNANLTLYAQWYGVANLENWYTTVVQSGDFKQNEATHSSSSYSKGYYYIKSLTAPSESGWINKGISGYSLHSDLKPFIILSEQTAVRALATTTSSNAIYKMYMMVKSRNASSYTSEGIDARIDRLQKLQDVALTYSDIVTVTSERDNISMDYSGYASPSDATPPSGWKYIGSAGYVLSTASTNGQYSTRTFVSKLYRSYDPNAGKVTVSNSVGDKQAKVKLTSYWIRAKDKTARTTTFAPTSNKGLARYNALTALNSAKNNYFPSNYIKIKDIYNDKKSSCSSQWTYCGAKADISLSSGKILGFGPWHIKNQSGYSEGGSSTILLNGLYTSTSSGTTTATMRYVVGGKSYTDTSAYDDGLPCHILLRAYIRYISSSELSVSNLRSYS